MVHKVVAANSAMIFISGLPCVYSWTRCGDPFGWQSLSDHRRVINEHCLAIDNTAVSARKAQMMKYTRIASILRAGGAWTGSPSLGVRSRRSPRLGRSKTVDINDVCHALMSFETRSSQRTGLRRLFRAPHAAAQTIAASSNDVGSGTNRASPFVASRMNSRNIDTRVSKPASPQLESV